MMSIVIIIEGLDQHEFKATSGISRARGSSLSPSRLKRGGGGIPLQLFQTASDLIARRGNAPVKPGFYSVMTDTSGVTSDCKK